MNGLLLCGTIRKNGDTQEKLSDYLGITRNTLSKKIHGKSSFTQPEIAALIRRYSLSEKEVNDIFFAS